MRCPRWSESKEQVIVGVCHGLNYVTLPHSYGEVLTPRTSGCDCIWRSGLQIDYEAKMRSLGWALIQYDWCPYKRLGHRHTDHVRGLRRNQLCSHLDLRILASTIVRK